MRYRIMKLIDRVLNRRKYRCIYCGRQLKPVEVAMYERSCEKCETKNMKKLKR